MTASNTTIDDIRTKIKEGGYKTIGGARKGISKTRGITEEDKDKLRAFAEKHFGGSAAPAAAPKKTAKKKATKKAASKKAAAKAPAKKKASKPRTATVQADTDSTPVHADGMALQVFQGRVDGLCKAVENMERSKQLGASVLAGAELAQRALEQAIRDAIPTDETMQQVAKATKLTGHLSPPPPVGSNGVHNGPQGSVQQTDERQLQIPGA